MRPFATAPIWSVASIRWRLTATRRGSSTVSSRSRRGVGLDIHLHKPGEMGLFNVQEICARTKALGLAGKVTISHGFCLGGIAERKAVEAAETMAEAGVALVTHGGGGLTMPPIEVLRAAGVLVFAGNDDIRDTWSPYGTGDLLERAAMIGWKGDFRRDDQVEVAFDLVSTAGARALGGLLIRGHRVGKKMSPATRCTPGSVQLTLTSRIGGSNLDAESIAGLCCFGNCASGVTITGAGARPATAGYRSAISAGSGST